MASSAEQKLSWSDMWELGDGDLEVDLPLLHSVSPESGVADPSRSSSSESGVTKSSTSSSNVQSSTRATPDTGKCVRFAKNPTHIFQWSIEDQIYLVQQPVPVNRPMYTIWEEDEPDTDSFTDSTGFIGKEDQSITKQTLSSESVASLEKGDYSENGISAEAALPINEELFVEEDRYWETDDQEDFDEYDSGEFSDDELSELEEHLRPICGNPALGYRTPLYTISEEPEVVEEVTELSHTSFNSLPDLIFDRPDSPDSTCTQASDAEEVDLNDYKDKDSKRRSFELAQNQQAKD